MRGARKRCAAGAAGLIVAALCLAPAAGGATQRAGGAKPVRACGSLQALGRTLRVDIADGRLPITCARARGVIRHYLAATRGRTNGPLVHNGQTWACYRSRNDGVGWDFHCNYITSYTGVVGKPTFATDVTKHYVDVGAGRR